MDLKNRLCDIETDSRDGLHSWLLRIVDAVTTPISHGPRVPGEEPSTTSKGDLAGSRAVFGLWKCGEMAVNRCMKKAIEEEYMVAE